jgi:hypothetical protein
MEHGPLASLTSKMWDRNRNDNSIMHTSQDTSIFHVFHLWKWNWKRKMDWTRIAEKTHFIRRNRYLKANLGCWRVKGKLSQKTPVILGKIIK